MKTPRGTCPVELRAAALFAAWNDCHDDDALIADRVTRCCIDHMLGVRDLSREAAPVHELYLEMIA